MLRPAVLGVPAGVITAGGTWLFFHAGANYSTCQSLQQLDPNQSCTGYAGAEVFGLGVTVIGVGLGIAALVLLQRWSKRPAPGPSSIVGWHAHPAKPGAMAYWDGSAWTWEQTPGQPATPLTTRGP